MPPREQPSEPLLELLDRLGLAHRDQLHAARHRARSLARDLPWFDSVWVDALVAMRLLTPFQAARINSGHGDLLGIGPYVLLSPLAGVGYADRFVAREICTQRRVWLTVCESTQVPAQLAREALATLAHRLARIGSTEIAPIEASGSTSGSDSSRHTPYAAASNGRIWTASPPSEGTNAGQWAIRNGRWMPDAAEDIARQTVQALATLEAHDLLHGDVSATNLFVTADGEVRLAAAGLRPILRPEEGYAHADLAPEAFDYLAPERVADGTPPTRQSDLYAWACLCWHLLTGRPPLGGGNSLGKLQAAHEAKIPDVRRLALDVPPQLAEAIALCMQSDPRRRPASFAALAEMLGPSTGAGRAAVSRFVQASIPTVSRLAQAADAVRHSRHTPVWTASVAGCALLALAIAWPWSRGAVRTPVADGKQRSSQSKLAKDDRSDADANQKKSGSPVNQHNAVAGDVQTSPGENTRSQGVIPVAYTSPAASAPVLELDPAQPIDIKSLEFEAGMIVRSPNGRRARIVTPSMGLPVDVDGVRFENIDFVAAAAEAAAPAARTTVVIIALECRKVEFHGCTFRSDLGEGGRCKAIAWVSPRASGAEDQLAAAAQLRMVDCVLEGVSVGVDCPMGHPLLLEFDNTLHLGPGPLWRLNECPAAERPVQVVLERVTIRDAVSLVDVRYDRLADEPGQMAIEANDCVLATGPQTTLVRLAGRHQPEPLLRRIAWTGQGSLLGPIDRFAIWYDAQAKPHPVDDGALEIDGLASGTFEFAGPATAGAVASQIVRWAAPLRSAEPPGIRPAPLNWPAP